MKCCPSCFRDSELISFINSNSQEYGDCDFCHNSKVKLLEANQLSDKFKELFEYIEVDNQNGQSLTEAMQAEWNIFREFDSKSIDNFLREVFDEDKEIIEELLNNKVRFNFDYWEGDEAAEKWEQTSVMIKNEYRFNPTLEIEELENILLNHLHQYDKGLNFYRARIMESDYTYKLNEMGAPQGIKASAGRANPKGISYLYVSTKISTTIHEVRASYYDKIAIGTFKLLEPLKIIRFRSYNYKSPFKADTLKNYKYISFMKILEEALSQPVRRNDSEIEYLPTQYLCEIVKRMGFDGVEYGSSLEDDGINLVIFNPNKLLCTKVSVYEIKKIEMDYQEIVSTD